jgi:uncharacterized protein (TIGR02466 family)
VISISESLARARTLIKEHRLKVALELLHETQRAHPESSEVAQLRASVLESLDFLPQALALYQDFAQRVERPWAVFGAARCAARLGHTSKEAWLRHPAFNCPEGELLLAHEALQAGLRTEALARFQSVLAQHEGSVEACLGAATVSSDFASAALYLERAIALAPEQIAPRLALAHLQAKHLKTREAIKSCDAVLEVQFHAGFLALKIECLQQLQKTRQALELLDTRAFIHCLPIGNAPLADAVAQAILAHPSAMFSPTHHATQQGFHTGELFGESSGPLAELEELISQAVQQITRALPAPSQHPFVVRRPTSVALQAWGVALKGPGFQEPHLHPDAWMSGVYYAQVPELGSGDAGHLQLNIASPNFNNRDASPIRQSIRPKPGLLVLFPSSVWHATRPTGSSNPRVSVAFDVGPMPR